MMKNFIIKTRIILVVSLACLFGMTSCYEEPDGSQLFDAEEMTLREMIVQDSRLSAFSSILQKCGYDKKISTYMKYTCFAPVNEGVEPYIDSLYYDNNKSFPHNGIQESANWGSLSLEEKVSLMSDSLCEDLSKYHLSGETFMQVNISGATSCSTLMTARTITVDIFRDGSYAGKTSLNGRSAIIDGDIEASNGILHICTGIIPRSDRTIDDQMHAEGDFTIFHAALQLTGLDKILQVEKKDTAYNYTGTDRDGNTLYCPTECLIKWTVFAETDDVFKANGINSFEDLKAKCIEWYGNPTWYNYVSEHGVQISTGDDYTNEWNVVHMFVAYHILRAGMPIDKIVYEYNSKTQASWNLCFGYEPQEYFETLLPNTLMKVWETRPKSQKNLYINRYRQNNTMTEELGTFGNDGTHPIVFEGVPVDRTTRADGTSPSVETLNGYIHRIKGILLYDQNAVNAQNERIRLDSSTFLYELINNGIRFATPSEVSVMNSGGDGNRVAFDNAYFENIRCYNPGTLLRFNVMGAWRANNSDQFQGWNIYDFAIKLPHVPTGTYELRIVYPPMGRGGLMQFYLGNSSSQSSMIAQGIPFDACADPTIEGNVMGCEPILEEYGTDDDGNQYETGSDYGVESDQRMHVRGYMRAPASFSRGTYNTITEKLTYDPSDIYSAAKNIVGSTSCRSEWGYGTMMLRRIICTQRFEQGKDYWLRIKNLVDNEQLGWSFDFVELCPVSIANSSSNMKEDWY
jgi:hypothetical protein